MSHAETLAVVQAFLLCQWIQSFVCEREGVKLGIHVFIDSRVVRDLVHTSNLAIEKYMIPYVQALRHLRGTKELEDVVWITGSMNLADPLTKRGNKTTIKLLEQVLKTGKYEFNNLYAA
mmetsp:Transcript_20516/g.35396  ORF Transcript_20516/g.35396 Transcript_20516/m.35396 type:complete len:119 (+) Transcript_20516:109-465(+)